MEEEIDDIIKELGLTENQLLLIRMKRLVDSINRLAEILQKD